MYQQQPITSTHPGALNINMPRIAADPGISIPSHILYSLTFHAVIQHSGVAPSNQTQAQHSVPWLHCRIGIESSRPRARLQSEGLNTILLAIGTTLNTPDPAGKKAIWLPQQVVRFLGMYVDAAHQRFMLPEDKQLDIVQTASTVLQSTAVSNRQLAQLAGKIIAAAPALHLSPLWAKAIYQAMNGDSWDQLYPSLAALKADVQCYLDLLAVAEGGNWWKRHQALLVAGDASEYAYAAYTPGGEFRYPVVVTFSEEELERMASNAFSSTLRELLCILHLVKVLLEVQPASIQHKRLRYETDSQAGWHSVLGMKGNDTTFPVVKQLLLLCAQHDVELEVIWKPRSDAHQVVADHWSKVEDSSDFKLNDLVYQGLITDPLLAGHVPSLDAFASSATTKVPGAFYSKFYCPGSKGVDAMIHPWTSSDAPGLEGLAYIYGPFSLMGAIISKIKEEQVNCSLVGPNWPRSWMAVLHGMPAVRKTVVMPHRDDLCIPGPHVPKKKALTRHPSYQILAWYILW